MEFEWDERKRAKNLINHGIGSVLGAAIFGGRLVTTKDERSDYGETRYISVGFFGDICLFVVHTARDGRIRLISTRKGGRRDRKRYQDGVS